MAKPTQPIRDEIVPCYQCPCIAICRIKVKQYDGTNMWGRLWNFVFAKECDLIYKYTTAHMEHDLSLKDGFDILRCLELIDPSKLISRNMNDQEIMEVLRYDFYSK